MQRCRTTFRAKTFDSEFLAFQLESSKIGSNSECQTSRAAKSKTSQDKILIFHGLVSELGRRLAYFCQLGRHPSVWVIEHL